VIAAAGLLALAATALVTHHRQAFTLGVVNGIPVAVGAGSEICQFPITVPRNGDFDGVTFSLGTDKRPGPAVDVTVRDGDDTGPPLARGRLDAGYPDLDRVPSHTVWVGRVAAGRTVAVCLANHGPRRVHVMGNAGAASRTSNATIDRKSQGLDINVAFERRTPRSVASLVPAMLDRAALFRAGWVGAWTYVLVGILVLLVVPALLIRAVALAEREPPLTRRDA
jgi:hypothetical protein